MKASEQEETLKQAKSFCYGNLIKLIHHTLPDLQLDEEDYYFVDLSLPIVSITIEEKNTTKKCDMYITEFNENDGNGITIFNDENESQGYRGRILIALNSLVGMAQLVFKDLKKKYPELIEYNELHVGEHLTISLDNDVKYKLVAFIKLNNVGRIS